MVKFTGFFKKNLFFAFFIPKHALHNHLPPTDSRAASQRHRPASLVFTP